MRSIALKLDDKKQAKYSVNDDWPYTVPVKDWLAF
jgi:hypothetical protein